MRDYEPLCKWQRDYFEELQEARNDDDDYPILRVDSDGLLVTYSYPSIGSDDYTLCYLADYSGLLSVGVTRRHENDDYSAKVGRRMSFKNAVQARQEDIATDPPKKDEGNRAPRLVLSTNQQYRAIMRRISIQDQ